MIVLDRALSFLSVTVLAFPRSRAGPERPSASRRPSPSGRERRIGGYDRYA